MLKQEIITLALEEFEPYWKFIYDGHSNKSMREDCIAKTGPFRRECSCRVCKRKQTNSWFVRIDRRRKKMPKGNSNVHVHAWCGALPGAKEGNCRVTVRRTSNHVFINSSVIPARLYRRQISLGLFNNFFRKATQWPEVGQSFANASPPSPGRWKAKKKVRQRDDRTTRIGFAVLYARANIQRRFWENNAHSLK